HTHHKAVPTFNGNAQSGIGLNIEDILLMTRFAASWKIALALPFLSAATLARGAAIALPTSASAFIHQHCAECHDADTKKGDLDLTALPFDLNAGKTFDLWVKVHDRVENGEMPPKKKAR